MHRLEQEPVTNFRRDVVADDELRIRVETIVGDLLHRERIVLALLARGLRRWMGERGIRA